MWLLSKGASKEQISSLHHLSHSEIDLGFNKEVFDEIELLCLELTKQMTLNILIEVDKDLKMNIQKLLGTTAFVELVTVISAYNMVSRFLVVLDIPIESNQHVLPITTTMTTTMKATSTPVEIKSEDSKIENNMKD